MAVNLIAPKAAQELLDKGEAVLVDVREPGEYTAEHIACARNLPLSQVTWDAAHLPEHKGKKLIVHCLSGKRAQMACEKLQTENSATDVWNLTGGIMGWKEAGLPVVKPSRFSLPINQQVQLVDGSLVLIGTLVGAFVHPLGLLLSGFVGCGLMFAGSTGWCGMALLLAKMPWNNR